jgi:hypothetical protein
LVSQSPSQVAGQKPRRFVALPRRYKKSPRPREYVVEGERLGENTSIEFATGFQSRNFCNPANNPFNELCNGIHSGLILAALMIGHHFSMPLCAMRQGRLVSVGRAEESPARSCRTVAAPRGRRALPARTCGKEVSPPRNIMSNCSANYRQARDSGALASQRLCHLLR